MTQNDSNIFIETSDSDNIVYGLQRSHNSSSPFLMDQQILSDEIKRKLTEAERNIVKTIDSCLRNWHQRWKETFLTDGREFKVVYDLMEGLLHYEYQITSSDSILYDDKRNAIARAVARLVDYGNAILGIDLIIRSNDETSSEIDPTSLTSIEMFQAHLRANKLREKLLYDYFKKDKPSATTPNSSHHEEISSIPNATTSSITLHVPSTSSQNVNLSPKFERSHRSSVGSNSSLNTISDGCGRKTPQLISPSASQIELKLSQINLGSNQAEITHTLATIRSHSFSTSQNSRLAFMPGILAKIKSLMSATTPENITDCFELLDALLHSIEKLPADNRSQEVIMVANALLEQIVKRVHLDDRENLVGFQHAHWTTCLISIMSLMRPPDFSTYLGHFRGLGDLGAFLKDYLFTVRLLMSTTYSKSNSTLPSDHRLTPEAHNFNYPEYWIEMTLLACSTFLSSLIYLYQVLRQLFSTKLQMWTNFIDCLVHVILQDTLKPDRFMLKERQQLLADDLRQTSSEYVWISWHSLSIDQKQSLLEDLIEPLLMSSIILRSRQRSILLPIFYDMMRCDYTSQYITSQDSLCSASPTLTSKQENAFESNPYQEDHKQIDKTVVTSKNDESLPYLSYHEACEDGTVLTRFTHLIVEKLNKLMIDLDLGDEVFKNELCTAISGELNPKYHNRNTFSNASDSSRFKSMAKHTADLIAEFIQICLDIHHAHKLYYNHLYLLCLFKLILFFKDKVDLPQLYLNNLLKLCSLNHGASRYVEAGFTLLEHAKALPWSEEPLENHYSTIKRFFETSQPPQDYSGLKISLYNRMVDYFDEGQLWEAAIPLCRELIDYYQYKTFEYDKLSQILAKMSIFFNNIAENGAGRGNPEYFRVTFYGSGFPESIRNSTMVYRGKAYEKLGDFQVTMLNKYPHAKLLHTLAKPDATLLAEEDARYLQINACSPIVDLKSRFGTEITKIDESIINYYRYNECDKFQFSRRISRPSTATTNSGEVSSSGSSHQIHSDDNFANMWRERTTLTTNSLPGMLPFFPVYLIETSIVSPIESAIEDLERNNDRLSCMVNRFRADKHQTEDVRLLGQLLVGVVDAAVNGGITKYEEAFFVSNKSYNSFEPTTTALASSDNNFESVHAKNKQNNELHEQQPKLDRHLQQQQHNTKFDEGKSFSSAQVDKLKCLIAKQVPILDEAIRLHSERVAEVMRPQHEHLEASYKKLKHNILTNYSRYLPSGYNRSSMSTLRAYRSMARSPNRSIRSESRLILGELSGFARGGSSRCASKRASEDNSAFTINFNAIGRGSLDASTNDANHVTSTSNIPYKQLSSDRSLPNVSVDPEKDRYIIRDIAIGQKENYPSQSDTTITKTTSNTVENDQPQEAENGSSPYSSTKTHQKSPIPAARSLLKIAKDRRQNNHELVQCITTNSTRSIPVPAERSQYARLIYGNDDVDNDDDDDDDKTPDEQSEAIAKMEMPSVQKSQSWKNSEESSESECKLVLL